MSDTVIDGVTTSDVDRDTSTETESDWIGGGSVTSLQDYTLDTATASSTLTGTDASTDTDYEASGQVLGLAGVIVGGYDQDIETGSDTSSDGTTGGLQETYTTTHSDAESDTGDSSNDITSEVGSETASSSGTSSDASNQSESMTDIAPRSLGKEDETRNSETFHRNPAGNQSRPAELGQQPEASLARGVGNLHREA